MLILFVVGLVFVQRSHTGVSATVTTKPGAGNAKFYAEVRNSNSYAVSVEVVYTYTRGGGPSGREHTVNVNVPARQTKTVQLVSGTDIRVRLLDVIVTPLN